MYFFRLCPLKTAGTVFFNSALVAIICLLMALCGKPADASFDFVELLVPGDTSDVLAAGLALPAEFALYPDLSRPVSLLTYPSSITTRLGSSHPWQNVGDNPVHLGGPSASAGVSIRRNVQGVDAAVGASVGSTSMEFTEDGKNYTRAKADQDGYALGTAIALKHTCIGISVDKYQGDVNYRSTVLSGIETIPDTGIGYIASNPRQMRTTVEIAQDNGPLSFGLLSSSAGGDLDLETLSAGQAYSAHSDTSEWRLAPYIIRHLNAGADMLLFDTGCRKLDGPVLVGNILAGEWECKLQSSSAAYAHLVCSAQRKQLYSLQYSTTQADLSGDAGGLLPGFFNSFYSTDNSFSLRQITGRYGVEHTRGKTAVRWSVMLSRCMPNASTYTTQAAWLRPRRILTDETLNDVTMWIISPAVGAGYTKGDYHIDAGLSLYGGFVQKHDGKKAPSMGNGASPARNRYLPGFRLGITIRRDI